MTIRFLLLAGIILSTPLIGQEYEIDENEAEEAGLCIPEEECETDEVSYRCRRRYRNRRRCCCWRDIDASWPGKMDNTFREEMRR